MTRRWWAVSTGDLVAGRQPFDLLITVPFCYQASLSGIDEFGQHDVVWYARPLPSVERGRDERLLLHFGAVDYVATVWVNGIRVADHRGGHTSFSVDITDALRQSDNVLVLRASDVARDLGKPRGKQSWETRPAGILYTPTTGIWQSVWLEPVPTRRIERVTSTSDVATSTVTVELELHDALGLWCEIDATLEGQPIVNERAVVVGSLLSVQLDLLRGRPRSSNILADDDPAVLLWSPESPNLYGLRVRLVDPDGSQIDVVESYFGLRSVAIRDGQFLLNGKPYYQRLVLDQGYWPDGLMTAPTDGALRRDIEIVKSMGFNGVRKHQKVEDPRWLYWADVLGLLVWSEMPSGYEYSPTYVERLVEEWLDVLRRDRGHPSVVVWVPMNESWGVPQSATEPSQRAFLQSLYHLTRAVDGTRPVVSNDGWEHADTDLITIHDYRSPVLLASSYVDRAATIASKPSGRTILLDDSVDRGQPMLLTEFGGLTVADDVDQAMYRVVADGTELLSEYRALVEAVRASPALIGYCYTQLTDIDEEANGLLTAERTPKVDIAGIREINCGSTDPGPNVLDANSE